MPGLILMIVILPLLSQSSPQRAPVQPQYVFLYSRLSFTWKYTRDTTYYGQYPGEKFFDSNGLKATYIYLNFVWSSGSR